MVAHKGVPLAPDSALSFRCTWKVVALLCVSRWPITHRRALARNYRQDCSALLNSLSCSNKQILPLIYWPLVRCFLWHRTLPLVGWFKVHGFYIASKIYWEANEVASLSATIFHTLSSSLSRHSSLSGTQFYSIWYFWTEQLQVGSTPPIHSKPTDPEGKTVRKKEDSIDELVLTGLLV